MIEITESNKKTYACKSCRAEFIVPENESAVCCPICRMNRIKPRK